MNPNRPKSIVNPFERGEIDPDFFRVPARWDVKVWFRNAGIGLIKQAGQSTGLK
jgi:hypothetical protein